MSVSPTARPTVADDVHAAWPSARGCHLANTPSPSMLKRLQNGEGGWGVGGGSRMAASPSANATRHGCCRRHSPVRHRLRGPNRKHGT